MAVELADGRAMMNYRNYASSGGTISPHRGETSYTMGADGEITIPDQHRDIPEPPITASGMQSSIIRANWPDEDDGATWPVKRLVDPGPSAYSDMAMLPDGCVALLYERGGDDGMNLAALSWDWLRDG